MTGGRKVSAERQKAADWRIVWQMFIPCVVSDLISGCVEVLGHLDGNAGRIVSSLLTFTVIYPFYWRRIQKKKRNRRMADAAGMKAQASSQIEKENKGKSGYFWEKVPDVWKILVGSAAFSALFNMIFWALEKKEIFLGVLQGDMLAAALGSGVSKGTATLFSGTLWQQFLLMGLAAPLSEELLFRGILFERLRVALPFFWAALGSASFFGLVHVNWAQGMYAALMGLVLAWLYEKKGRLREPVLFHSMANLTSLLMQVLFFRT